MQRSKSKSSRAKLKSKKPRRTAAQVHAAKLRKRTDALVRKMHRDKARADAKAAREKARADAKATRDKARAAARAKRDKERAEAKAAREKRKIEARAKAEVKVAQSGPVRGKRKRRSSSVDRVARRRLLTAGSLGDVAMAARTARDLEAEVLDVLAVG